MQAAARQNIAKHNMAAAKSNTTSVYFTNSTTSKHGVKKEVLSFTSVDACLILHSMTTLFIDILTDFILVVTYFMNGHIFWGSCTLALVVIPAVIMQGFSLRWHMLDGTSGKCLFVAHLCLLGVFLRYVGVLRAGQEARRSGEVNDFQSYFHQQSDVCMLHLFESFMESAPQILLQFYIAVQIQHWNIWTGVSVAASLVSVTWAVSSYSRVMRRVRPEKQHISVCGLALQAVWRVGMISARITALVLFAICCQAWLFLLLGLHWLGMTVWVVLQKSDPNSTSWEEYAYNAVVGVVYCFCFFNLREGRTRARMLAFYVITVAQNLACLYLFLALKQHTYPFLAQFSAVTIVCGTVIGLGAMLLYYRFFHPCGVISLFGAAATSERHIERSAQPPPPPPPSPSPPSPPSPPPTKTAAPQQNEQLPERSNSVRSLKRLWAVDRDGSLASRSDDVPLQGGSPQSDKRLLLSARRPISTDAANVDDSQISWNCPSLMEDSQSSDVAEANCGLNKRRGICSSVELGLDLETLGDAPEAGTSFCPKLVSAGDVKQLAAAESGTGLKRTSKARVDDPEKRESDYIDSKQSSDGTPSEVLSAHDYENICAVNIAREAWGLRSWRGYSDIETWLHDDSVVRDRRRDTIVSVATTTTTTTTAASSERSAASESPPPTRQSWEPAPPLPNRRPRPSYNRMDDYLDTLADDLAEIERREAVFLAQPAQPYLVDMYPVPAVASSQLDTIMEELEESSCTSVGSPGWASSLVATIDEIRTGTASEGDFDIGSYHSLQFDTSADQRLRFSYSLPSLLHTPRSWSHITPEQVSHTQTLSPATLACFDRLRLGDDNSRRCGNRPRRKFSLLRERFEKPVLKAEAEAGAVEAAPLPLPLADCRVSVPAGANKGVGGDDSESTKSHHWNSYMRMQNRCNAEGVPPAQAPAVDPFGKQVLKRVLTPPRLHTHKRSLVIASNASA